MLHPTVDLCIQLFPLASETLMISLVLYSIGGVVLEMRRLGQQSFLQVLQRDGGCSMLCQINKVPRYSNTLWLHLGLLCYMCVVCIVLRYLRLTSWAQEHF